MSAAHPSVQRAPAIPPRRINIAWCRRKRLTASYYCAPGAPISFCSTLMSTAMVEIVIFIAFYLIVETLSST